MLRRTRSTLLAVTLLGALCLPVAAGAAPREGRAGQLSRSVPTLLQATLELLRSFWTPGGLTSAQLAAEASSPDKPITIEEGAGLDPHGGPRQP